MSGFNSFRRGKKIQGDVTITGALTTSDATIQNIGGSTGFGGGFVSDNDSKVPSVTNINGRIITKLYIDLAGNASTTDNLDIIGDGTTADGSIYKHVNSINGLAVEVQMHCVEDPATGADDIDLYISADGAAAAGSLVTDLTEAALITSGGAWEAGLAAQATFGVEDLDGAFFYLTCGEAGTAGEYSTGKFIITIIGNETF